MDLALVGNAVRSKPAAFAAAVGRPAVIAVGIAGLSLGFYLWYALALRGPHGPVFLELSFLLALVAGVTATYAGWIAYGHYFARRARVDEITALQYDALSWSALVLLWGTLLAPSASGGTGRAAAFAVSAFVLAKLAVAARFNRTVRDVSLTFVMTRLPMIAIAELAAMVIGQRPGVHYAASANPLLAVWGRWDAEHYLRIAGQGYFGTEPAFFPLYPLLIRIVSGFTGSLLVAGLIVSNTASFLSLLYLYKLVEHEYNRHVAQRATFFVSIFPTAIFFSAVYSESLFLFLTVASFYYVRERRWLMAGVFGFFAALTRSEGVLARGAALHRVGRRCARRRARVLPLLGRRRRQAVGLHGARAAGLGHVHGVLVGDQRRPAQVLARAGALGPVFRAPLGVGVEHHPQDRDRAHHADRGEREPRAGVHGADGGGACGRLSPVALVVRGVHGAVDRDPDVHGEPDEHAALRAGAVPDVRAVRIVGRAPTFQNAYVAFSLPLLGLFTVLFADWYWVA